VPAPSIVVSGATTALVRRTTLRKAFLAPWHPLVSDCWLYSLAYAQLKTDVAVHYSTLVINHHHTDVTPSHANLPEFTQLFHRDLSCALHALLCREGYDAPRELFDDRDTHRCRLLDAPAQAGRLIYDHLNPVTAGLVQRPDQMPQQTLDFRRWKSGYIEVQRPPVYFSKRRPERLRLRLEPPPLLLLEFGGDLDRLIHHMERLAEDGIRAVRRVRRRPAMGAATVRQIHPWSEPWTMRESGPSPNRTFQIGARGFAARDHRIAAARETRWFRARHAETRVARRSGRSDRFPYGTYAARVHHGAPTELEPHPGAIVSATGPLLRDVRALSERASVDRQRGFAVLDEVRQAVVEEAADLVADANLSPPDPPDGIPGKLSTESRSRAGPKVRHRLDGPNAQESRRLVVLRDTRRRQPQPNPRRGADPPG